MSAEEVADVVAMGAPVSRRAPRFLVMVLVLGVGGGAVGVVINLALAVDASAGTGSWRRTVLTLAAVGIAAVLGALVARSIIDTRELARRTTIGLEKAAIGVDAALGRTDDRMRPGSPADRLPHQAGSTVVADATALHERLDQVGAQLDALRRSGNRTAWWTFVLGAVLGVLTQILLG